MSSRRTRQRRRRKPSGLRYVLGGLAAVLILALAISLTGAVSASAVVSGWLVGLPDYESPEAFEVAQATRIYSADGVLLAKLYLENRTVVPMSQIATDLAHGVVAVEDERFYEHDGVDIPGVARAAVTDVISGSLDEGASTITQQYIDNTLLLDERLQRNFRYKAREAYLAMELEKRKSKDEILELYLNAIYFGEGAYGAQAASKVFFSKDAKDLTLAESALLAGLPQAPSGHNPYDAPEAALVRRDEVLRHMLDQGYCTQAEYDEAIATPLNLKRADEPADGIYQAHYFVAHVKKLLQEEFSQSLVFQGGLEVHTTIDTRTQKMAEDAVFSSFTRSSDPDCALVSVDPRNGYIMALVGGEDFSKNKFNLATQGRRQPGSSFKTFVLVTALEEGHPPNRYINGSSPVVIPSNPKWTVYNSGGGGSMTLQSATRGSVNAAFARLIWELNEKKESGAEKVAETARRMGITSNIPPYPSIALGSHNTSPLDMASAYGTLAANGQHYPPVAITKVVGADGNTVFEAEPKAEQALTPEIAYATTQVLKGVISGGTGTRANIGRPAAGKTGTSQNYRDAWFVGYTPQLATAVWVGYHGQEKQMRSVNGVRGFGGTLAAPVWAKFMKKALAGEPKLDFKKAKKPKYTWKNSWSSGANKDKGAPGLVGKTVAQARSALSGTGFKLNVKQAYHDTVTKGKIISQSVSGKTITVTVSLGKKPGGAPAAPAPAPEPPPDPEPEPQPEPDPDPEPSGTVTP